MIPALIHFVRRLAGDGATLAVGAPPGPSLAGMPVIDEDGARGLAEAARAEAIADPAAIARLAGVNPGDLARGVVLVMAGRNAGWHFPDLLDLLPHLVRAAARVVVVARPVSVAGSPAALAALLAGRGAAPFSAGISPRHDPIAPGCPVAVIERPVAAASVSAGAILRCGEDLDAARASLRTLASMGMPVAVVDPGSGEAARALAGEEGVLLSSRAGDDAEPVVAEAASALGADWIADLNAGEHLRSPLPDLDVPGFLALLAAMGHDEVVATIADVGPPLDGHEPGLGYWRFAPEPAAFGRVVARRTRSGDGDGSVSRSPYNLLLLRDAPGLSPSAHGVNREPFALAGERGDALIERLSGHGVFALAYPAPPMLRWTVTETVVSWHGNVLKAGIGRLPYPDPAAPVPGSCLVRWDTLDGAPASLLAAIGDVPERFVARGGSGTVTIDNILPGSPATVRLVADGAGSRVLGSLRLAFEFDPGN
ncbi:MAG: hypothetical protein ACKOWF_00500 [Chloroflexota bacterium]